LEVTLPTFAAELGHEHNGVLFEQGFNSWIVELLLCFAVIHPAEEQAKGLPPAGCRCI
jgi:hypothetical protein